MDHRISKDMISNGMTPSGQRSQQDLSRSQYGSAATPASLAEAYRQIHESMVTKKPMPQMPPKTSPRPSVNPQDKVKRDPSDYGMKKEEYGTKDSSASKTRTPITAGGGVPSQSGQVDRYRQMARERARKNSMGMESTDLFDIVKGHLMSEGLSEEDALKKMLEMTEEEKAEIVEGAPYVVTNADMKGNTKAYQNFKAGMKNKLTGKPLYVAAPHLKGV